MLDFGQSKAQSGLEPWPSLQESGATVHEGDPRQAGRVDFGSFETVMMSGVWECTQGKELGDVPISVEIRGAGVAG